MPLPTTPDEHIALIKKKGEILTELGDRWGERIFREMFQGDEFIDEIQEIMANLDLLSLDNPDQDIIIEGSLIDAAWYRIMLKIHALIKDTMQEAREMGQA